MRSGQVFLFALLLSLVSHALLWKHLDDSTDQQNWVQEMKAFYETSLRTQRSSFYYGYPATTLLGPSYILALFGVPAQQAFIGIMVLGISLSIACSAMLCRLLRPESLWWVGALGLMITSQLYYTSTPPSAVIVTWSTLLMLYSLYVYEKGRSDIGTSALFGSMIGISLATRLDVSLVLVFFLSIFILPVIKKHIGTVLCFAFGIFILCDPYMWMFPVQHLVDIIHKIRYHTTLGTGSFIPFFPVLINTPFISMGFVASLLVFLFPNTFHSSVPRRFLTVILIMCVGVSTAILLFSAYHPRWYFYPFLQIFEVFFVLYLVEVLMFIRRGWAIVPLLGVLLVGNGIVLFTKLFV